MKRIIVFIIITLILILSSLSFNIVGQDNKSIIIKVDDDGTADYTSIQEAIDNASDWDIIYVYNGVYNEKIKLNKRINLTGENKYDTIIDGNEKGSVIKVTSNYAQIRGFTIRNSSFMESGIKLDNVRMCYIGNNYLEDNTFGILLDSSVNNKIISNYATNNEWEGISLQISSNYNIISNNTARSNGVVGIDIGSSDYNYITHNEVSAFELWYSHNNTIINNNIRSSSQLLYSCNNIFIENEFRSSFSTTYSSNDNRIMNNNFYYNYNSYRDSDSVNNNWNGNYWKNWPRFLPRPIMGYNNGNQLCFTFDWQPAREPYNVSTGGGNS